MTIKCIACGGPADGTYGRGGPPICFDCYESGSLVKYLDTTVKEWQLTTGKGTGEGKYIKPKRLP